jgi:hypothetical protein
MAFVQRFEKFIHKGTQSGVQIINIFLRMSVVKNIVCADIKLQRRKIGASFNDEIGIIHRIEYKFVGVLLMMLILMVLSAVIWLLKILYIILHTAFILIKNNNYRGKDEQIDKKSRRHEPISSSLVYFIIFTCQFKNFLWVNLNEFVIIFCHQYR